MLGSLPTRRHLAGRAAAAQREALGRFPSLWHILSGRARRSHLLFPGAFEFPAPAPAPVLFLCPDQNVLLAHKSADQEMGPQRRLSCSTVLVQMSGYQSLPPCTCRSRPLGVGWGQGCRYQLVSCRGWSSPLDAAVWVMVVLADS